MKSDDMKNKWMRDIQRTTGLFHREALCNLRQKTAFLALVICYLGNLK